MKTHICTQSDRGQTVIEEDAKYKFLGSAARETDIFFLTAPYPYT
jgi:hypothetical protein